MSAPIYRSQSAVFGGDGSELRRSSSRFRLPHSQSASFGASGLGAEKEDHIPMNVLMGEARAEMLRHGSTLILHQDEQDGEGEGGGGSRRVCNFVTSDTCSHLMIGAFLRWITESVAFHGIIMLSITFNAVTIAVETNKDVRENNRHFFEIIDIMFISIYTLEFVLKFAAGPREYWVGRGSGYNRFDFAILAISYVQLALYSTDVDFTFLRVVRALRALRALRSIAFIRPLQVLVSAFYKTLGDVVNLLLLLFLVTFVFAIVGFYLFGYDENGDQENWGTLPRSLLSLFTFVTVDGWTLLQDRLDEVAGRRSRWFSVIFIFIGHFIFSNLFIGVIIENIDKATEEDKAMQQSVRDMHVAEKKKFIQKRQQEDYQALIDQTNLDPSSNLDETLQQIASQLSHTDLVPMQHLSCNLIWLESYLAGLHHQENTMYRQQQLHFDITNTLSELVERRLQSQVQV